MSNYTKTTDFQAKDSLPTGNANKVVKGAEIDTEFNAIATAIATKANTASPTFTGTITAAAATFSGNVTLGDAATDTVTVTADVASNLIPSADSTYALGDSSNYWSNAYVDAVTTTGNISVGGNLTVTGNATISGTLTFGDADTDSITLNAEIASDVIPDVDGTYDLGSATKEWQDLYIDGTANIDSLVADTAAISAGTIDNTVIGGTTAVAGTFTTATATTGAITTVNSTTVNATTVDSTNVEVTNIKAKDGTASASIADATGVMTIASSVLTTADINGGSIDGTTVGATTASTGNFSTLSIGGTAITATAAELNALDGITATVTELNYTDGVTSNIQTQLDAKQASDADLTAIAALSSADGNFIVGSATGWVAESGDTAIASLGVTATAAELNYVDGVTSAIQTQLDAKAPIASPTFTGTTTIPTADINGGTIDGVTIGGASAGAGTFTTLSTSGNTIIGSTAVTPLGTLHVRTNTSGAASANVFGDSLIVESNTSDGISILNPSTSIGSLMFGDESDNFVGGLRYDHSTDELAIHAANAERMRITSTGVGIGTSSPGSKLEIQNAGGGSGGYLKVTDATYGGDVRFGMLDGVGNNAILGTWTNNTVSIYSNSAERMSISGSGNTTFYGSGYFKHVGTYARTTATAANLYIYTDGQFYRSTSSRKYKENISDYDKGLSEVLALRPVYYTGTGDSDGDKQYAGLIAEEVHDIGLSEFVQYAEDDTPDALSYGHMVALLTKAIQEQQAIIDDLKARIETLEGA